MSPTRIWSDLWSPSAVALPPGASTHTVDRFWIVYPVTAMSLNVKNDETRRPAAELARLTAETMTGAITGALRQRIDREHRRRGALGRSVPSPNDVPACSDRDRLPSSAATKTLRRAGTSPLTVDTSALLAILLRAPDASRFEQIVATTPKCRRSVASALEARAGTEAGIEFDTFLETADIELAPVTVEHLIAAGRAWRLLGKGKHRVALSFGDCFAYALAEATAEPPLFKGTDLARYPHTDRIAGGRRRRPMSRGSLGLTGGATTFPCAASPARDARRGSARIRRSIEPRLRRRGRVHPRFRLHRASGILRRIGTFPKGYLTS